jgi:class 3 adenylate cyclase
MVLSHVLSPVLVGRDSELSTLEDALLSALRGDGGVVIVGGEAGMGKTRLVNALATRARTLGCVVLAGGCSEAELSLPYLPFLEAVGNYLSTTEVRELGQRLGPAASELAQLFPQLGSPPGSATESVQAKLRLFESILILLRDAARHRALLLILEDLQWADPATRELLDYATRRLRSTSVLVVATYRTDEMHRKHALLPTIQGWRRNGQVELVELKALNAKQIADMVCAIFEERSISDEFRDFLHERSEGNPFVLEEMLRDAIDRGDIFRKETGWDRKAVSEIRIPPNVRDTILQRLERLSREDVGVLSAASVMGRSFDIDSLAEVAEVDGNAVLSALEASVSAQLIEEEERRSGCYRFRHALTQEAIYEDLVAPRRLQLHSRVADVMESRHDHAPVDQANHLFMAGRNEEAVAMSVAAAESALGARAYRDAAELLERAAPYVSDSAQRARMLCRAGEAYHDNAESQSARRLLEAAIPDLEKAGFAVEAAMRRVTLGRSLWELMRSDLAREQFERARAVLEPNGPSEALANLYIRISGLASFNGDHRAGIDFARKAVDTAERAGADLPKVWSLTFLGGAEAGLGQVTAGFAHLEESYQGALAGRYDFQVGNAVYNSIWLAIHLGRGDLVEKWAQRISAMPQVGFETVPSYAAAFIALERGQIVDAIRLAQAAVQKGREGGHEKWAWRAEVLLAHALAENLRAKDASQLMPPTSRRVDKQDVIYDAMPRVRCRLAGGDLAGAEQEARLVPPEACEHGSPVDAVAEGTRDAAWLREFIAKVPAQGETMSSPRIGAARGRLALYEGRFDDASQALSAAVDAFESGKLHLDGWHVGSALAEAEFRSGHADLARTRLQGIAARADLAAARLAARVARDTAARLGLDIGPAPDTSIESPAVQWVAPGERMVSVLFADVRGYTQLAGHSAPSELADRISALQRWATQEVERRNGVVDKFAGDAVMATFNVSGQSVDHTLQALRAAVAIIDKSGLAGLPVGAAVAVGPAVVGNLAESANLSVLGEVTNLASRLQAQAQAGEVILAEDVYRRVKDWLDAQQIPAARVELQLKGFDRPVLAYKVTTGMVAAAPA